MKTNINALTNKYYTIYVFDKKINIYTCIYEKMLNIIIIFYYINL
jgi:hypothetical protein